MAWLGIRIGWIACQDQAVLKKIEQTKHYTSICNSAPSEILALIALRNKDKILERNNRIIETNLKTLDKFFHEYANLFEWARPQGGCVGFVKYKEPESVGHFCDQLIKTKGLLLLPASIYGYEQNYFRIGLGRKNMPECVEKLKGFLRNK